VPTALVTGGAGFLGSSVVRELLGIGDDAVRVLALPGEPLDNLDGLDVEIVRGDVTDPETALSSSEGVETLYHCAAIYKDYMPDPRPMYTVNLRGTFNMLEAARRNEVATTVYTSSITALGRPAPGLLSDESAPYEAWDVDFPYTRTKYLSQQLAEDFAAWGLDVRIVCPGVIFGPRDIGPTPSGKIIINALSEGAPPLTTEGGSSYADVRDVAKVHVLAAAKGEPGAVYAATAHNLDNRAFLQAVLSAAGLDPDKRLVKVPGPVMSRLARVMEAMAVRKGEEPDMTAAMLDYSRTPLFIDNRRSIDELGVTYRSIEETIGDAIADFRARGLIT
jgi:dihydroflavonol-4-reductase